MIWEHALGGMRINIEVARERNSYTKGRTTPVKYNMSRQINLPCVCRQIYSEIGAIVYRHKVFSFAEYDALLAFRNILKQPDGRACIPSSFLSLWFRECMRPL